LPSPSLFLRALLLVIVATPDRVAAILASGKKDSQLWQQPAIHEKNDRQHANNLQHILPTGHRSSSTLDKVIKNTIASSRYGAEL